MLLPSVRFFFVLTISYEIRSSKVVPLPDHQRLCICVYPLCTGKHYFVDVFSIKKNSFTLMYLHVVIIVFPTYGDTVLNSRHAKERCRSGR